MQPTPWFDRPRLSYVLNLCTNHGAENSEKITKHRVIADRANSHCFLAGLLSKPKYLLSEASSEKCIKEQDPWPCHGFRAHAEYYTLRTGIAVPCFCPA